MTDDPTPPRPVPPGPPLNSTDAQLDEAAVVTTEDIQRARQGAPPAIRAYVEAQPVREP